MRGEEASCAYWWKTLSFSQSPQLITASWKEELGQKETELLIMTFQTFSFICHNKENVSYWSQDLQWCWTSWLFLFLRWWLVEEATVSTVSVYSTRSISCQGSVTAPCCSMAPSFLSAGISVGRAWNQSFSLSLSLSLSLSPEGPGFPPAPLYCFVGCGLVSALYNAPNSSLTCTHRQTHW